MSEFKHSKGVNVRGDTLVCVDYHKPQNHIYIGLDFHGNRKCCCGGMFLTESLVKALSKCKGEK